MSLEEEEEVDEKLGSYFECLSLADRKRWLAQDTYWHNKLGITTMGKWSREQLRTAIGENKVLKNSPNYEILSNVNY